MKFIPVLVTTLFVSIHAGALIYVNSSFLGSYFSATEVSILFSASAIGNIILFLNTPRMLGMFTKRFLLFLFLSGTLLGVLGLTIASTATWVAVSFLLYGSCFLVIYYLLDIFLEEISMNTHTGEIRGIYFTCVSAGVAAGPLLLTIFALKDSFKPIYLLATLLLAIPLLLSIFSFHSRARYYEGRRMVLPFKHWWHNSDLRSVTLAKLALETFFGIMVIYTPLYLHKHLGFEWSELGIIFTVALLPFVFLEWPAGEVADRWLGEKEIMSLGFFVTGTTLLFMPFLEKGFAVWMVTLLISRIGASLVEITTESYFFKKIDAKDTGILSIFRLVRPVSLIFAAVLGAVFLHFFSIEKIFFLVSVIMFFGLRESLYIKDTL